MPHGAAPDRARRRWPGSPGCGSRTRRAADWDRPGRRHPLAQFAGWLTDAVAAGLPEPNAMVVATADAGRTPAACPPGPCCSSTSTPAASCSSPTSARARAASGREPVGVAGVPVVRRCCARCVVVGAVEQVSPGGVRRRTSRTRPYGSQLGAWASAQSTVIASREAGGAVRRAGRGVPGPGRPTTCRCRTSGAASGSPGRRSSSGRAGIPAARPAAVPALGTGRRPSPDRGRRPGGWSGSARSGRRGRQSAVACGPPARRPDAAAGPAGLPAALGRRSAISNVGSR